MVGYYMVHDFDLIPSFNLSYGLKVVWPGEFSM